MGKSSNNNHEADCIWSSIQLQCSIFHKGETGMVGSYLWMVLQNNHHGHVLSNSADKLNHVWMSHFFQQLKLVLKSISVTAIDKTKVLLANILFLLFAFDSCQALNQRHKVKDYERGNPDESGTHMLSGSE